MLAEWPREDVEQLVTLLGRLHETAQERLSSLPELAIAEFHRSQSGSTPPTPPPPTAR
jgi:hypothetical protein